MDIFFSDPTEIPLPPDEVRIRELKADPYQDGRRVRVYLEVDPFQRRPSAEITVTDSEGIELAGADIIETMSRKMEITLHVRGDYSGELTLAALLFYAKIEAPSESGPPETARDSTGSTGSIEKLPVDRAAVTFRMSA